MNFIHLYTTERPYSAISFDCDTYTFIVHHYNRRKPYGGFYFSSFESRISFEGFIKEFLPEFIERTNLNHLKNLIKENIKDGMNIDELKEIISKISLQDPIFFMHKTKLNEIVSYPMVYIENTIEKIEDFDFIKVKFFMKKNNDEKPDFNKFRENIIKNKKFLTKCALLATIREVNKKGYDLSINFFKLDDITLSKNENSLIYTFSLVNS